MIMLFIHAVLWLVTAMLAIVCAVIAFKHKWYFVGVLDVAIAFIDLAAMIGTIVNYFTN